MHVRCDSPASIMHTCVVGTVDLVLTSGSCEGKTLPPSMGGSLDSVSGYGSLAHVSPCRCTWDPARRCWGLVAMRRLFWLVCAMWSLRGLL